MSFQMPEHWCSVRLADCLKRRASTVLPSTLPDDKISVVGLEDIEDGGRGGIKPQNLKPAEVASLKTAFKTGDILYGKLRPYLNKVGIASESGYCSTEIWAFTVSAFTEARFVRAFLSSAWFVDRVASLTKGANLPRLDSATFDSLDIPLPPLSEQQRTVEILQEAEQVRRLRSQAESKTAQLIPAIYHQMFRSAPDRNTWEETTVEKIAVDRENSIRTGPFGSDLLHSEFVDSGIPVLGIDNAVSNRFKWSERRYIRPSKFADLRRFKVFPDDVMITIMGTVGRVAIAPKDLPEAISTKHLCVITADKAKVLPTFLWATLLYDSSVRAQTRSIGKGAIMEGWNSKIIRALRFLRPPIALQDRFNRFVEEIFRLEKLEEPSQALFDASLSSLLAHAFTGELTAEWREKHKKKLEQEAHERDEALKALGATISRPTTAADIEKIFTRRTDRAYAELSREQHSVLEEAHRGFGGVDYPRWFTAAQVAKRLTGSLHTNTHAVEAHLAVLTARGLVIAVSREEENPETGEFIFGNAYRLPLNGKQVLLGDRQDDHITTEADGGIIVEEVIGDNARSREMQRLVGQLEKERML